MLPLFMVIFPVFSFLIASDNSVLSVPPLIVIVPEALFSTMFPLALILPPFISMLPFFQFSISTFLFDVISPLFICIVPVPSFPINLPSDVFRKPLIFPPFIIMFPVLVLYIVVNVTSVLEEMMPSFIVTVPLPVLFITCPFLAFATATSFPSPFELSFITISPSFFINTGVRPK